MTSGNAPDMEKAAEVAGWYRGVFGDRYFIEIQDNGLPIQKQSLGPAVGWPLRMGIPVVATSDVHYVSREDSGAQDVLICVNTGKFRTDQNRMRMDTDQFYLRSPEEMYASMPGLEHAVKRSQEIADSVDIQLELGRRHFPVFTPPGGQSSEDYLRDLCIEGLKERHAGNPKRLVDGQLSPEVMERLERELKVISKLGFPNYF